LICPAWYLVATAWRSGQNGWPRLWPMGHARVS
jgi:hypothetical protein